MGSLMEGLLEKYIFLCALQKFKSLYSRERKAHVVLESGVVECTRSIKPNFSLFAHILTSCLSSIKIPILNIQVKIFPALCTVAGTIFSCTNYFGVIFTGGVGKNGSTIAVSTLFCWLLFSTLAFQPCLQFLFHIIPPMCEIFSFQFLAGLGEIS